MSPYLIANLIVGSTIIFGLSIIIFFASKNPKNRVRQKIVFKKIWKIELIIFVAGIVICVLSGFFFPILLGWLYAITMIGLTQVYIWSNVAIVKKLDENKYKENQDAQD